MIKKHLNWIQFHIRQNLSGFSFYCMLLCILASVGMVRLAAKAGQEEVKVLVVSEGSQTGDAIAADLVSLQKEGFRFEEAGNPEELITKVRSGQFSCGLILGKDLDRASTKKQISNNISFYQCAESIHGYTVRDVIFPTIFKRWADRRMESFIREKDKSASPEAIRNSLDRFKDYQENSALRIYKLERLGGSEEKGGSPTSLSYRVGLWLLFIAILFCAGDIDVQCGEFFKAQPAKERRIMYLEALGTYAVLSSLLAGLICFPDRIPALILFSLTASLWAGCFTAIAGKKGAHNAWVLAVMAISLIACPVVYDLSLYLPPLGAVGKLFPVTWFI